MEKIEFIIKKNTWAVILLAIIFSFLVPQIGNILKPYLNYLLGALMFLGCLNLTLAQIKTQFSDIKSLTLALLITQLLSPLVILIFKPFFSPEIYLGLIIASTIPCGLSVVFLSKIYGGNPAQALIIATTSNALGPITVPILVWLFAHTSIHVDPIKIGLSIFYVTIIPLTLALILGQKTPFRKLSQHSSSLSIIILFLLITGIISPVKNIALSEPKLSIFLLIISIIQLSINYILGSKIKKPFEDQVTLGLCSSYKNFTLSTLISLTYFSPIVALPSIIYTISNNILLLPLEVLLKSKYEHSNHR